MYQLPSMGGSNRSITDYWYDKDVCDAFTSSLDYCNSLLFGVNETSAVQNAAARVTTETRKFDHIRPVLHKLHWLPVGNRIMYKLAVMVYKCLHGLAPPYLAVVCVHVTSVASRRHPVCCVRLLSETLRSLGTVCRLICELTPNRCRHSDRGVKRYLFTCHERIWRFFLYFRAIQMFSLLVERMQCMRYSLMLKMCAVSVRQSVCHATQVGFTVCKNGWTDQDVV